MKNTYKVLIISIALILSLSLFFLIRHHVTKEDEPTKIVVADGLSINYLSGDALTTSPTKNIDYIFSVTNDSNEEKYYKVTIDNFASNETIKYNLKSEDTKINVEDASLSTNSLVDYVVINPGDTHNYTLTINKYLSKFVIGTLVVSKYTFEQQYFAQTIIANSSVSQDPKTVVGEEISNIDEGLIQDIDDDGITYYFRGNVQNNYVKFADMMWRIVRINGNNTVRLVLNDTADDLSEYYTDTKNNYFAYSNTEIKSYLSSWYSSKLFTFDKYIATSKVCDDSAYTGKEEYIFNVSQRLTVNNNPTFNCLGTKINSKVSLLTADEVEYAGALIGVGNDSYYLYNSSIQNPSWTMSPSKGNENELYPYIISTSGSIDDSIIGNQKISVRPVINIRKDLSVIGKGTIDEPYELLF